MKDSSGLSRKILLFVAISALLAACAPANGESGSEPIIADEAATGEENSGASEADVSETSGSVQEIDQSKLVVNDLTIAISADTVMPESAQVGDEVSVRYISDADGKLSAVEIEILTKASVDDGASGEEDEEIDY